MNTIEIKFSPGDTAWVMHQNKAVEVNVTRVDVVISQQKGAIGTALRQGEAVTVFVPHEGGTAYDRSLLFATKEELLASLRTRRSPSWSG